MDRIGYFGDKMKKILAFSILLALPLFAEVKVAVFGGLWPMPVILSFLTDAQIVYMPKASVNAAKYSVVAELKPEFLEIPYGSNENIEELLGLDVDVYMCHIADMKLYTQLQRANKEVISFPVNVENYNLKKALQVWLEGVGKYFDIALKQKEILEDITQTEEFIAKRTQDSQAKVMILKSLNHNQIALGGRDYLIEKSGGENVFKSSNDGLVNLEAIYKFDPDVIFITNFTDTQEKDLLQSKEWQRLKAVKEKRVHKLPLATYRPYAPSLDIAPTLLFMAKKTYPSLFEDISLEDIFKKHFLKFYGIPLTQKQVELILKPDFRAGII
ncbi:ABC transporter substrate-binding protein [Helicobacter apodemus]|uniref:ABC transporter substrate-binding protein n=2 Tax=Helicobacter apodemus TaxID=135569 RepID=A0A4U8UDI5_9HELI|nr:ABC transporter substrate-binding protein [Helicobacter apodemus]